MLDMAVPHTIITVNQSEIGYDVGLVLLLRTIMALPREATSTWMLAPAILWMKGGGGYIESDYALSSAFVMLRGEFLMNSASLFCQIPHVYIMRFSWIT